MGRPVPTARPALLRLPASVLLIVGTLAVMWLIEILDTVALDDHLQANGIHPRSGDGIDGILWAPFLHSTFSHLVANSFPFLILGGLVALRGAARWFAVSVIGIIVGGGLTWLLAGGGNHIGASGVVFTYFGALVGAAVIERRPASIAPALVALLLYSGILAGLAPRAGISWEGHLFGLVAGMVAARVLARRRPVTVDVPQPWEADQPWLTE